MYLIDKFKIEEYNIGFITKGIDAVMNQGVGKGDILWLKHKYRDRFFADPFLLYSDENYLYIVCEEFLFFEEKGKIALLKVDRNTYTLIERQVFIEEETHLSFPYCKYGDYVIIPESSASGKCVRYTIDKNTFSVIKKEVLVNTGLIDSVFWKDHTSWIYTARTKIPSTELDVYKRDTKGQYVLVSQNPVLSDNRRTRSAGDFFYWKGKLYRPVQDCKGRYGRQTKIMEIKCIGEKGYHAEEHITLNSFENPPYSLTMLTFNVYEGCILVDGSDDFLRFPDKLFYKKFRFLFRNRLK